MNSDLQVYVTLIACVLTIAASGGMIGAAVTVWCLRRDLL